MPYIDYEYYKDEYLGKEMDQQTFDVESLRASEAIDRLTMYKIVRVGGIEKLHPMIRDLVKKATAQLTEYFSINGGFAEIHANSPNSVTIGKFSYSKGTKGSSQTNQSEQTQDIPDYVYETLSYTGLLYRGVHLI